MDDEDAVKNPLSRGRQRAIGAALIIVGPMAFALMQLPVRLSILVGFFLFVVMLGAPAFGIGILAASWVPDRPLEENEKPETRRSVVVNALAGIVSVVLIVMLASAALRL